MGSNGANFLVIAFFFTTSHKKRLGPIHVTKLGTIVWVHALILSANYEIQQCLQKL